MVVPGHLSSDIVDHPRSCHRCGCPFIPKKPSPLKNSIYECGIETYGPTRIQFKAQYYIYAILFLIFDVEIVFLFPFAVAYNKVLLFGVIEVVLFVLVLAGGLAYAWRRGALEWS